MLGDVPQDTASDTDWKEMTVRFRNMSRDRVDSYKLKQSSRALVRDWGTTDRRVTTDCRVGVEIVVVR